MVVQNERLLADGLDGEDDLDGFIEYDEDELAEIREKKRRRRDAMETGGEGGNNLRSVTAGAKLELARMFGLDENAMETDLNMDKTEDLAELLDPTLMWVREEDEAARLGQLSEKERLEEAKRKNSGLAGSKLAPLSLPTLARRGGKLEELKQLRKEQEELNKMKIVTIFSNIQ